MKQAYFNKKSLILAAFIVTFLAFTGNSVSEETEGNPVPIHFNLKESAKISPETNGDLERVAIEETHSSYESNPGANTPASTRNKGDFVSMGTWESDAAKYSTSLSNVVFNLWWSEDTSDENYNAELELIWTIYVDGTQIFEEQFGEVDDGYSCVDAQGDDREKDDPCEFLEAANSFPTTEINKGQVVSIEIEMRAYQRIYIFYDNFTRDSGMKVVTDALKFGNAEINGNTISIEFIEAWSTDCSGALNANFITIIANGIELDNNQQSGKYPKIEKGSKYVVNDTEIDSEKITWLIDDKYAKLEQSIISFSYSRKDSSTTEPILINIADKLISGSETTEEEGLLGLPGFELATVISALFATSFIRRKV